MSLATQSSASVFHPGFGQKLKVAREALGLTTAEVASRLKLGERQIEAIEAEDFAELPGEVFIRGFVRNYARLVSIDPEQVIIPVDSLSVASGSVTAPSEDVTFASPGLRRWVLLPLLALGFFVLLVALLYYWLRQGEEVLVSEPVIPRHLPAETVPASTPPQAATASTPPQQAAVPISVPPPPRENPVAAPSPATAPAAQAVTSTKGHALVFSPNLDAWVQVVDGQGKHFSRLIRAGNVETFSGEPPFKLVVGEAAQVTLSYDGHRIDLTPFIGQKVARLTLE